MAIQILYGEGLLGNGRQFHTHTHTFILTLSLPPSLSDTHTYTLFSTRYDDMVQESTKKQDSLAEKLAKMQQDYQQSLVRAGIR